MPLSLDALWVIVSASLVFVMQAGFLCVEAGSTRRKNNINVALKNISDLGLSVLVFWAFGYGLMFGASVHGWWGFSDFFPEFNQADSWPIIFFLFQAMFCSTAVTILSGAVAERMTFRGYLLITLLISGLIYPVFGHWVWSLPAQPVATGWLKQRGFVDFAGSTVVHSLGGWISLAALVVIGPRLGRFSRQNFKQQAPSSDLPLAFFGALLLWFGWFGFNGGSTFAFNDQVPRILVNTLLAGSAGLMAPLIGSLLAQKHQLPFKSVMNGSLAGLVAITASCHSVSLGSAVIIGGVGGLVMMVVDTLLDKLNVDDAVGVIPVHLGPGIWGTLAVALLGDLDRLGTGLSRWDQFLAQVSGVLACGLWSFTVALLAVVLLDKYGFLRVSHRQEYIGLNVSEHGAQNEFQNLFETMQIHARTGSLQRRIPTASALTEIGQISRWYNQVVAALERSTARTNAIITTAADAILTVDPSTLIVRSTNPAVETIFGSPWLKAIGQSLTTLMETDLAQSQDAALQSLKQFLDHGCSTGEAYVAMGIHRGGRRFPIEVSATDSQLRSENFLTIMVRDITDRKAAETALMASELEARKTAKQLEKALNELKFAQAKLLQREKMAGLGQLVAGISHEINNPVGFIYGNLEHAMQYVDDLLLVIGHYQKQAIHLSPEVQAAVDNADVEFIRQDFPRLIGSMTTGTERIRNIVQALRKFARFDESELKTVDIHSDLDNTLMMLMHRLNVTARRPQIVLDKRYGSVPRVQCYAGAMNQVFLHLLNNAIDVLGTHGAGKITIKTEDRPDFIAITIADNGPGIPKALRQQIFEPFFTTKPVGEATGMGLAISHQIVVEQHGGELLCESVLGRGTTFTVVLPKSLRLRSLLPTASKTSKANPMGQ